MSEFFYCILSSLENWVLTNEIIDKAVVIHKTNMNSDKCCLEMTFSVSSFCRFVNVLFQCWVSLLSQLKGFFVLLFDLYLYTKILHLVIFSANFGSVIVFLLMIKLCYWLFFMYNMLLFGATFVDWTLW